MAVLLVLAGLAFVAWRVMSWLKPAVTKLGSMGDDIGGWTLFFVHAGQPAKQVLSGGARLLLFFVAFIVAIFWWPVRVALLVWVGLRLLHWWTAKDVAAKKLAASGFSSATEQKLISETVTRALLAMNLGSKAGSDGEMVPPRCWNWRKLPVLVGGKPLPGQWRYECRIEPAPGKSVAQLMECAGRGLDADKDDFRDNVNSMLRAARGRDVKQLRSEGLVPTFTLSTLEQITRKGEKIGLGRLTLWTTDPFSRAVRYPYDPAKPIIRHFTDRAPVGLLRSNAEDRMRLDKHTSIQGINGSAKSSLVRPPMMAAAHTNAIIIVIALKGPADYIELRKRFAGAVIITDKPTALRVLRAANDEIQRRNHLASKVGLPHVWIVLDEGQELGDEIAAIVPIVKKGRSALVWLWSVTQYGITSIIPSEAAREMGQRYAGRIEGTANQAVVAVGSRANKTRGPHLIPEDSKWVGVLFGSNGEYLRAYWVSEDGPKSLMARCARGCPARPADPAWFVDALNATDTALPPIDMPSFPADGARRAVSGEARSIEVAALPELVRVAVEQVWAVAGRIPPEGSLTATAVRKVIVSAEKRLEKRATPDVDAESAIDLLNQFLTTPLTAVPTSQEADQ